MIQQSSLELINHRLREYPKMAEGLGQIKQKVRLSDPIYKQNPTPDSEYTIYGILSSRETCYHRFKPSLIEINRLLSTTLNSYYTTDLIKEGLSKDFFSFLSELKFAEFFILRNVGIEINPKLSNGKKLDFRIEINSITLLVEVIKPFMKKKMLEEKAGTAPMSAELEYNFYHEFYTHKIIEGNITEPLIIAVNGDYGGYDEINVITAIQEFDKKYPQEANLLIGILLKLGSRYSFFGGCNKRLDDKEKNIIYESLK